MRAMVEREVRELDRRRSGGVEVALLWSPQTNRVFVEVDDELQGDRFRMDVAAAEAREAFDHPYAYAGRRRLTD